MDLVLRNRDSTLAILKDNMHKAQARMKRLADLHRTEREFQVDDWVFLRLQPYRQQTAASQAYTKLSPKYHGPFKILERIGPVAYRLQLPPNCRIHPIFHVSLLKQSLGVHDPTSTDLPIQDDKVTWLPAKVLQTKFAGDQEEWLVHWEGFTADDATWEMALDIQRRFPKFQACGQPLFRGRRDDGNPTPLPVRTQRTRQPNPAFRDFYL